MKSSFYKYAAAASLAAVSIAYVAQVPTEAAIPFKDVPQNSSHYAGIEALYNAGIITGHTATEYKPSVNATRAEVAFFIANALGLNQQNVKNPGFTDVPTSHPYYGAIAALYKEGIISGTTDKNGKPVFNPNNPVRRDHVAKMITLGFGLEIAASATTKFADVNALPSADTRRYIQTLVDYEITTGTSKTMFSPLNNVTRAQIATFIYRTLQTEEELEIIGIE